MIIFVVGGSKSQKSNYGEIIAEKLFNKGNLYYLATMKPYDDEDSKRIEEHIKNRSGHGYITIEVPRNISSVLPMLSKDDTVLLDSITSLVTNEMFNNKQVVKNVKDKIITEVNAISKKVSNLVIVSDYVFSDGIRYDDFTEDFRKELGIINCEIAKMSQVVIESSFGNIIVHKGKERINNEELIECI